MMEKRVPSPCEPYVGPDPLEIGRIIFGRDREKEDLTDQLLARRIVLLHALSGAGKTSLVQAGLVPVLKEEGFHVMDVIRVNKLPPAEWSGNRYVYSVLKSVGDDVTAVDNEDEPSAINLAKRLNALWAQSGDGTSGSTSRRAFLIFDQFEEILTQNVGDQEEKQVFFSQLVPVLYDVRYSIILAMREDFLAELEPYLVYFPDRLSARFRLELLKQEAAIEAIREPALECDVEFRKVAAEKLVDDLRQVLVWQSGSKLKRLGLYVEPMHLQVVCLNLWQAPRPNPGQISLQDVQIWGNVDNALRTYYDEKVANAATNRSVREQDIRDYIEGALITGQGLRGQAREGQENDYDLDTDTLLLLTKQHLLRREERRESIWYELAHDRLVEPVRQANGEWRKRLTVLQLKARPWLLEGKPEGLLLSGEDLAKAAEWATTQDLSDIEAEYLMTSLKAYTRSQSRSIARAELGTNLEETGWGVIFAEDADPLLLEALRELLDHRQAQASRIRPDYYREFTGLDGYRQGETAQQFLARFGVGYGPAKPDKMPHYLLIVGDPQIIPFEFQYGLDVQYAVGRIYFDKLEEYQSYARTILLSESGTFTLPNRAILFGTEHPGDRATHLSLNELVHPLLESLQQAQPNWRVEGILSEGATKEQLGYVLGGDRTPAFLFTASHGLPVPSGDPSQPLLQGALVCQDWPGSEEWGGKDLTPDLYFSEEDISEDARLLGMVAFLWGSFTAATPEKSDARVIMNYGKSAELAPQAMLSKLPQRLLGHSHGGALAVIGLAGEGWTFSFQGAKGVSDLGAFENAIDRLLQGYAVGNVMDVFNNRYAVFSSLMAEELKAITFYNKEADDNQLRRMMMHTIDARGYLLIGDPAVRLPVNAQEPYEAPASDWVRPAIEAVQPIAETRLKESWTTDTAAAPLELAAQRVFNGLDATTGEYMFPAMSEEDLARAILGESLPDSF